MHLAPVMRRVLMRRSETADTVSLWIEVPDAGIDAGDLAGRFCMLGLPGIGEIPVSVSGADGGLMHTIRAVGHVSRSLCMLEEGSSISIRGPYGRGWPLAAARKRDVLLIGGGLGVAPLRLAWQQLCSSAEHDGRLSVMVGARGPSDIIFLDELRELRATGSADVLITVDHASSDWQEHVGVVTELIDLACFDPQSVIAFVCGPEIMMRFCARALIDRGVNAGAVFLSMERNMHCAVGRCGHCQWGPLFICRDGPVFAYDLIEPWLLVPEL